MRYYGREHECFLKGVGERAHEIDPSDRLELLHLVHPDGAQHTYLGCGARRRVRLPRWEEEGEHDCVNPASKKPRGPTTRFSPT